MAYIVFVSQFVLTRRPTMKKIFQFIAVFFLLQHPAFSQTKYQAQIDSLKLELANAKEDSTKLNLFASLLSVYALYKPQEGITYKDSALQIVVRTNSKRDVAKINDKIGRIYWQLGKFSEAYKYHFTALDIYNKTDD